jgi:hypothetical protein
MNAHLWGLMLTVTTLFVQTMSLMHIRKNQGRKLLNEVRQRRYLPVSAADN